MSFLSDGTVIAAGVGCMNNQFFSRRRLLNEGSIYASFVYRGSTYIAAALALDGINQVSSGFRKESVCLWPALNRQAIPLT